jgi:hypothetical protein
MHDGMQHQPLSINEDMSLLALDLLAGIIAMGSMQAPFFPRSSRSGCQSPRRSDWARDQSARDISRRAHGGYDRASGHRAIDRNSHGSAFRRQIPRDRVPLVTGAEDVHQAIDDLADVHRPLVPTRFGGRDPGGIAKLAVAGAWTMATQG